MPLNEKNIVVGTSSGIGREIALLLAANKLKAVLRFKVK